MQKCVLRGIKSPFGVFRASPELIITTSARARTHKSCTRNVYVGEIFARFIKWPTTFESAKTGLERFPVERRTRTVVWTPRMRSFGSPTYFPCRWLAFMLHVICMKYMKGRVFSNNLSQEMYRGIPKD